MTNVEIRFLFHGKTNLVPGTGIQQGDSSVPSFLSMLIYNLVQSLKSLLNYLAFGWWKDWRVTIEIFITSIIMMITQFYEVARIWIICCTQWNYLFPESANTTIRLRGFHIAEDLKTSMKFSINILLEVAHDMTKLSHELSWAIMLEIQKAFSNLLKMGIEKELLEWGDVSSQKNSKMANTNTIKN